MRSIVVKPQAGEYLIHVGLKKTVEAYRRIAAHNKNERIRAIQHHRSWKELTKKISPSMLVEFNRNIIKNRIILDGVLNESAYKDYVAELKRDPRRQASIIESLGERMADYTVFPDQYFDFDAEIWIFRDTTLIISWKQETATEIRNASITGFFRDMFDLMKNSGRKIDHNQLIRSVKSAAQRG